ncbi:uncharacterized protein N0V89_005158 [Didymosphaeria variabile]|uniref:Uncharacterized protein n=1 Tax=Didymosphaeria variabile TaxID=1932322 RepID=A0A9W8XL30_9PLEO|nr:uncharacterized protein N0V89_005158 [Didymosphaeria variabile]KAJ4353429.1 hypothetical protein N0V89_005158 [Didymosphaeria variabile]
MLVGPWKLTPWEIVEHFESLATQHIIWTINFVWDLHGIHRAKELPWKKVYGLLEARIWAEDQTKPIPRVFTKAECDMAYRSLPGLVAKAATDQISRPSPISDAAGNVEQTPLRHGTRSGAEQATPTNSSAERVGHARNITTSSTPLEIAVTQASTNSRSGDLPPMQPSSLTHVQTDPLRRRVDSDASIDRENTPVQPDPLGRRDDSNASMDREHTPQTDTAPSDTSRATGQAVEPDQRSVIDAAPSGDSRAPSQTRKITRLRSATIVEDLNSSSALSTRTLSHILDTFLPTHKAAVRPEDDFLELLPAKVLDLCTLLHAPSSGQAHDQEALTMDGTNGFSGDSHDIET